MPLTAIAFWLVYIGGVCAAVIYPVVGVALYVLVYHVNPQAQWWGSSFVQSGIRTSLTVAVATVIGVLLRRPRLPQGARQFPLPIVLMLLLFGYALLTLTWVDTFDLPITILTDKIVKQAIFVLILVRCIHKPEHYTLLTLTWVVGVAYIGYQATGGGGHVSGGRLDAGLGGPDFAESSGLAVHLVASLPLIGAQFFMSRTWWGRGFALLAGALVVNAIIMTRTRNAIFGVAAMAVLGIFWLPRGYRLKGLLAMVIGLVLSVQLIDRGWWERMATIRDYQQDLSATSRLAYWRAAVEMAYERPQGIGLGQFKHKVGAYLPDPTARRSSHNTFLNCLAEQGLPGIVLFVGLLAIALARLRRLQVESYTFPSDVSVDLGTRRARFHLGWHTMALRAALVGYLVCGMFTMRLWAEGLWMMVGMSCCLVNVTAQLRAREGGEPAGLAEPCVSAETAEVVPAAPAPLPKGVS